MKSFTASSYMEIHQFPVQLGGQSLYFFTKPGLPDWEEVFPSLRLFADSTSLVSTDKVLLFGSYQAAFGIYLKLCNPSVQISIHVQLSTEAELTRRSFKANHIPIESINLISDIDLPPEINQSMNTVYMQIPKGRSLARRWLVQICHALQPGGSLYLAGANNAGIQSIIKDAQALFGAAHLLGYKKGHRLARLVKRADSRTEVDWMHQPGIAPNTWIEFPLAFSNQTLQICSLPGVFSSDHLDEGTEMLLNAMQIPPGSKVLDVGCGNGIIGICAALQGAGMVHLIDNNLMAIAASRETIARNHIVNATVFAGDLLNPVRSQTYDLILSNPPFHTSHTVDYQIAQAMIIQSFQALNPGGKLIIVSNRFIRYDALIREIFGNLNILAESGKFHVLSGLKSR